MQGDVYLNHDNLNRSESDRLFIAHRGAADIDLYIAQHRKTDFLPSEITQAQLKQVAQLVDLLVEHSRSFDRCADKISKIINLDQQSFVKELQISLGPTLVSPLSTQLEAMRSVIIDGFHALREQFAQQVIEKAAQILELSQLLTLEQVFKPLQECLIVAVAGLKNYLAATRHGLPFQQTLSEASATLGTAVAEIAAIYQQNQRKELLASYAKERTAKLGEFHEFRVSQPSFVERFGTSLWRTAVLGIDLYESRHSKEGFVFHDLNPIPSFEPRSFVDLLNACPNDCTNIQRGELTAIYCSLGIDEGTAREIAEYARDQIVVFPMRQLTLARQLGLQVHDLVALAPIYSITQLEGWVLELKESLIPTTMLGTVIMIVNEKPFSDESFKSWSASLLNYMSSLTELESLVPKLNPLFQPQRFARDELVEERLAERDSSRKIGLVRHTQERSAVVNCITDILKSDSNFADIADRCSLLLVYGFAAEHKATLYAKHPNDSMEKVCLKDIRIADMQDLSPLFKRPEFISTMGRLLLAKVVRVNDTNSKIGTTTQSKPNERGFYSLNRDADRISTSWRKIFRILEALPEGGEALLALLLGENAHAEVSKKRAPQSSSKSRTVNKQKKLIAALVDQVDLASTLVSELIATPLEQKLVHKFRSQCGAVKITLGKLLAEFENQELGEIHTILDTVDSKRLQESAYLRELQTATQGLSRILAEMHV